MASKLIMVCMLVFCTTALAQDKKQPPTRPFDSPGAPTFTRLDKKRGVNPPADVDGDFLIGPDYLLAPELKAVKGVPEGKVFQFTMNSKDGKLFNVERVIHRGPGGRCSTR